MKSIFQWSKNLNIRTKLLGGHTLVIVLAVLAGGGFILSRVQTTIETHIESELTNATAGIRNSEVENSKNQELFFVQNGFVYGS